MPGSCSVVCTVVNNTYYDLTLNNYSPPYKGNGDNEKQNHGEFQSAPTQSLPVSATTVAFSIQKAGGFDGSTGWVNYLLAPGSSDQLFLMFNNPYSSSGQNSNDNCWFYAVLQGPDGGPLSGDNSVYATVEGFTFNSENSPTVEDDMTVTVTLSNY